MHQCKIKKINSQLTDDKKSQNWSTIKCGYVLVCFSKDLCILYSIRHISPTCTAETDDLDLLYLAILKVNNSNRFIRTRVICSKVALIYIQITVTNFLNTYK